MGYISDVRTKSSPTVREKPTFIEAARRTQIIGAALNTIAELGFAQASLAQIALRAGISKGVIGYYFPSKDDLVRAAIEHFYAAGHEVMMARLATATTATDLLRAYLKYNLEYIADNRTETRAIGEIISNFRHPDGKPVFRLEDTEPLIEGAAAMFAWGQKTGEFREFDTRVMAVMLRACVDTFGQQLGAHPELDVVKYTEELIQLFTRATRRATDSR